MEKDQSLHKYLAAARESLKFAHVSLSRSWTSFWFSSLSGLLQNIGFICVLEHLQRYLIVLGDHFIFFLLDLYFHSTLKLPISNNSLF